MQDLNSQDIGDWVCRVEGNVTNLGSPRREWQEEEEKGLDWLGLGLLVVELAT